MSGYDVIFPIVFVVFIFYLLFARSHGSKVIRFHESEGIRVASDDENHAIMMHFPDRFGDHATWQLLQSRFFPWQMFSLGLLTGMWVAAIVARATHTAPAPAGGALWVFAWLAVFALVWTALYAGERLYMTRLRRSGRFEALIAGGADPLQIAAAVHFWMHRFKVHGILALSVGGLLMSLGDFRLLSVGLFLGALCTAFYVHSRLDQFHWVVPRELEKGLQGLGEHLADGGWVMPAGLILLTALFGMRSVFPIDSPVLLYGTACVVVLVLWSERVSRGDDQSRDLEEWREAYRERMIRAAAPTVAAAEAQTAQ